MLGNVYNLNVQGVFRADPHPHVVAVDLSPVECLVIPSFSAGGREVEEFVLDERTRRGLSPEVVSVELDNAVCVTWRGSFGKGGNKSCWLPTRTRRHDKSGLPSPAPGQMCDECLVDIIVGLTAFRDKCPKEFSARTCAAIDSTLASVRSRLAQPKT